MVDPPPLPPPPPPLPPLVDVVSRFSLEDAFVCLDGVVTDGVVVVVEASVDGA